MADDFEKGDRHTALVKLYQRVPGEGGKTANVVVECYPIDARDAINRFPEENAAHAWPEDAPFYPPKKGRVQPADPA